MAFPLVFKLPIPNIVTKLTLGIEMLNLSEVLIQNPQIETFDELAGIIKERSKTEIFFRIDVKPPYSDTPENWEDRLEAMFT